MWFTYMITPNILGSEHLACFPARETKSQMFSDSHKNIGQKERLSLCLPLTSVPALSAALMLAERFQWSHIWPSLHYDHPLEESVSL